MSIPASGPVSMSMFNVILGRAANTPDSRLAGGDPPTTGSLFWLAGQSGSLSQTAPFSFTTWYGYAPSSGTGVVTNGLVLYLDPGTGSSYPGSGSTWFDLSGNDYDGILVNTPVYSSNNEGILVFNGTDEYVDMNSYAGMNTGLSSFQIWVRDTAPADGSNHQIMSRTNTNVGTFNILKRNTGLWGANVRLAADPSTQINEDSTSSATSNWTNLAITYNGSNLRMYVNGVEEATTPASGTIDTAGTYIMNIARNTTAAAYFPGDIGVALAYNKALSAAEVLQNYDFHAPRYTTTGIQYIASTSSTGTTIDISGLGLLENDIVVVTSVSDGTAQNLPTGYTNGQNGSSNSVNYRWSYKRMGATPDTTVSGLSGTSVHIAAVFRNVDTTTALNVTSPTITTNTAGMPDPPSITTTSDGCMIVAVGFLDDDVVASSVTAPSGYTLARAAQYGSSGAGATNMVAYLLQTTAGAENPGSFSATGGSDSWVGATIALNPIGGGGGGTTTTTTTSTTTTTTTAAPIVRTYYEYPYTASRSTRTSTTYTNIASISIPGIASTDTVVFWMGTGDIASTSADARMRLTQAGGQAQINNIEPQDTTDRMSMGGMDGYASTSTSTWAIQQSGETTNTSGYAGYAMAGLQLTGSDSYNVSVAASSTTGTTYLTKVNVTPPAGDYIIVGSAAVGTNNTGATPRFRIFDGTNTYGEILDAYNQDANSRTPYWHVFRVTLAGSTTFSLQYRGDGSNQGIIQEATILALDASKFENVYYAEDVGPFTTTSTTYVNALSATFNIVNPSNKHLILASAMLSGNSTASSFACKLRNTTTSTDYCAEHLREPNQTTEMMPTVVNQIVTFSGASNTIAWQLDVESAGTTGTLRNMSILVIDLGP